MFLLEKKKKKVQNLPLNPKFPAHSDFFPLFCTQKPTFFPDPSLSVFSNQWHLPSFSFCSYNLDHRTSKQKSIVAQE